MQDIYKETSFDIEIFFIFSVLFVNGCAVGTFNVLRPEWNNLTHNQFVILLQLVVVSFTQLIGVSLLCFTFYFF